ncbi:MAG: hypothetical protein ACLP0J_08795 [Solirubrobacteraceae bacterium]|jgi:hypothetical protein
MTTKDIITLVIAGVGAAVALMTFFRALLEYRQQGRQRRTEQFFAFGRWIEEQPTFQRIRDLLDAELAEDPNAGPELASVSASDKFQFLGAYEELAILVQSGLVRREIAHYMHGYYAIRCKHSDGFWKGDGAPALGSYYWSVFADFAGEMEKLEQKRSAYRRRRLRF